MFKKAQTSKLFKIFNVIKQISKAIIHICIYTPKSWFTHDFLFLYLCTNNISIRKATVDNSLWICAGSNSLVQEKFSLVCIYTLLPHQCLSCHPIVDRPGIVLVGKYHFTCLVVSHFSFIFLIIQKEVFKSLHFLSSSVQVHKMSGLY